MPPLDQLQKHVIPIDAISKDIESAIQKIVEDIVNRREKIFYQLPNNMYDKPAPDRERRPKKKRQKEEAMRQRPVPYSARPPLRHLPPPPAAHRGLYSAASSPGSNQPAANTQPYYAIAKNGLGAGLKSLADYVKVRKENAPVSDDI